ncbi:MAG: tRNA (adenosine(37)-N6)-threonylcarbamoyltransferase complex dimerization subunit type 1 TsaB [Acidobacteriota bacterium]
MKILAVDTTSTSGSVAMVDGERVVAEWSLHATATHNRRLLRTVDLLLKDAGWSVDRIDCFAATRGPGSFTGIRIGLTTMKTLAWSLGKRYVAAASLDVLAAPLGFANLPVCALIDARKKEVYCALYQPDGRGNLTRSSDYLVIPPERVTELIKGPTIVCGDGWMLYRDQLRGELGDRAVEVPSPFHDIRASFLAEAARLRLLSGDTDDPMTSTPLYVRPSEAEMLFPHLAPPPEVEIKSSIPDDSPRTDN